MKQRFVKNSKYYTISIYTFFVVLACAIAIKLIISSHISLGFIGQFISVLSPFFIGIFIAYLINPLVRLLDYRFFKKILHIDNHTIRKVISIIISYVFVIFVVVSIFMFVIPEIMHSLFQFKKVVTSAQNGYTNLVNYIVDMNNDNSGINLDFLEKAIKGLPKTVTRYASENIPDVLPRIYIHTIDFISFIVDFVIALVISIYLVFDKERLLVTIKKGLYCIFKPEKIEKLNLTLKKCNSLFGRFVIGKIIDSTIIGFLTYFTLIILNLPYAAIIALIVGVTNVIPYFGPCIGAVPGVIILLSIDFKPAIIFTIAIICIQQLDGLLLGPKILGESTGLRPIWILFAIVVGGWVGGPVGMFIGVPIVAVISYFLDVVVSERLEKKKLSLKYDEDKNCVIVSKIDEAANIKPSDEGTSKNTN